MEIKYTPPHIQIMAMSQQAQQRNAQMELTVLANIEAEPARIMAE